MSKLEELIKRLCPDGVVYCKIKEVALVTAGNSAPQNQDYFKNGEYPFCRTSDVGKARKSIDFYDIADKINANGIKGLRLFPKGSILIPKSGASTLLNNKVRLSIDSFVVSHLAVIIPNEQIVDSRFLYYTIVDFDMSTLVEDRSYPSVKSSKIADSIWIPIPPLEVQQEIVRILDTFTTLEAELEAELEARKKQYFSYRDSLFNLYNKDRTYTLGTITRKSFTGVTPLVSNSEYFGGSIPWLRTQEVLFNDIYDTEMRVTDKALRETSLKWIPENCVIIAISGATAGRSAINKIPLTTNQHCCCLEIDSKIANYRYVFHWVSSQYENLKSLGQGARGDLNVSIIKNYAIPIPPIEIQDQIVTILDHFDTLVNDLSQGLPAEIAARRKQYEYYRNKLLTFKEVKHESL